MNSIILELVIIVCLGFAFNLSVMLLKLKTNLLILAVLFSFAGGILINEVTAKTLLNFLYWFILLMIASSPTILLASKDNESKNTTKPMDK